MTETNKKKRHLAYKLLISSYSLSTFSEGIIVPIYAVFVQKIGGDILDAGLAMGAFLVTQGLFTIIFHKLNWSRRHDRSVMIIGWVIWLTGIASYLVVSNIWTLFFAQIFIGLGNAIADPIFDKELASNTTKKEAEFGWAVFEGGNDLMTGLAAIAGGFIASFFGFVSLIWAMIIAATISLAIILIFIYRFKQPQREFIKE